MARTASGVEHIQAARKLLKSARTADDLRLAQSVLLPLAVGAEHRADRDGDWALQWRHLQHAYALWQSGGRRDARAS